MNDTIMYKEIFEQKEALSKCTSFNAKILDELAADIKSKKPTNVVIAARGTSNHVGMFAKYLFETYCGLPVSMAAPSVYTSYGSKVQLKDSLVIGISQSGAAQDVLGVINCANEQNAITIGVTNTVGSVVADNSKYHLFCDCGKENSVAATKTFTTQLYLVTKLIALVSGSNDIELGLSQLDDAVKFALSKTNEIAALALEYKDMNDCFTLARGLAYPIAMEAALKTQETCYVKARCYAVSDFHHGPFAMVDRSTKAFLIAIDEKTNNDAMEMLDKLNNAGASVFTTTNSQAIADKAANAIIVPDNFNNIAASFAAAVIAQLFACELSVIKGNNPDAPRGLNKVTVTK